MGGGEDVGKRDGICRLEMARAQATALTTIPKAPFLARFAPGKTAAMTKTRTTLLDGNMSDEHSDDNEQDKVPKRLLCYMAVMRVPWRNTETRAGGWGFHCVECLNTSPPEIIDRITLKTIWRNTSP